MSSWTDKPQTFTPYVQQQPVELMQKVGMHKQQLYDQGLQKIQSQVDNVAGLDVIRDVDKNYLQTKLNNLTSNLRTVAAGDFSNAALVSSVGGMTNSIIKDENIQNAVSSAATYRRGVADMRAANKAGKGGPSNDWIFQKGANEWMNNQDIKATFNDKYLQYTDYRKNAISVIKELTGDSTITDDAFTTVTDPKTGQSRTVLADAILRSKYGGITAKKIQTALMAALSPADWRQMQIDGQYSYSNVSDESFMAKTQTSYQNTTSRLEETKTQLINSLPSTVSAQKRAEIEDAIKNVTLEQSRAAKEYENVTKTFAGGNADSAKAMLYTADFVNDFSQAMSHTELSQTFETSPLATMAWNREKEINDMARFKATFEQTERHFEVTTAQKDRALDIDEKAAQAKIDAANGTGKAGLLPMAVDQETLDKYTVQRFLKDTEDLEKSNSDAENDILQKTGQTKSWLDAQQLAYEAKEYIDPIVKQYFVDNKKNIDQIESNRQAVSQIEAMSVKRFGDIYKKIPKDAGAVTAHFGNKTHIITPKDFVDFNAVINDYIGLSETGGSYGDTATIPRLVFKDDLAKAELSPKNYELYKIYKKDNKGERLNKGEQTILDRANFYNSTVNRPFIQTLAEINKFKTEELAKRISTTQPGSYTLATAKPADRENIGTILTRFADLADQTGGGLALSPEFTSELARTIAVDPNLKASLSISEGTIAQPTMYVMSVTGTKGKHMRFNVTPEQKVALFNNLNEKTAEQQEAQPILDQIRMMGGYSTAKHRGLEPTKSTFENAWIPKSKFTNVQTYEIKANVITLGNDQYSIRLNIKDPITGKIYEDIPYPSSGTIQDTSIPFALQRINDIEIFQMIHNTAPTAEDLKALQNKAQ